MRRDGGGRARGGRLESRPSCCPARWPPTHPTAEWCPSWPRASTCAPCPGWRRGCSPRPPGRLELVAVTSGPGLIGALLVGVRFAAAFAWGRALPLVAVDHLEGHLVSPFLDTGGGPALPMPDRVLALVASGGHSGWYPGGLRPRESPQPDPRRRGRRELRQGGAGARPALPRRTGDRPARPPGRSRGRVAAATAAQGQPASTSRSPGSSRPRSAGSGNNRITGRRPEAPASQVRDLLASFEQAVVDQLLGPLRGAGRAASAGAADRVGRGGGQHPCCASRLTEAAGAARGRGAAAAAGLTTDNAAMIARAGQLAHATGGGSRSDGASTRGRARPGSHRACAHRFRADRRTGCARIRRMSEARSRVSVSTTRRSWSPSSSRCSCAPSCSRTSRSRPARWRTTS